MEEPTRDVLTELAALRGDLAEVVDALRRGPVSVARQHELAARLIEVGELLDEHADKQAAASNGHADGFGTADNGTWHRRSRE